jgi:two-component system chemotaxis response regulator CheY
MCLDVMMPEMDGITALGKIREMEEKYGIFSEDGIKIIMTTAADDMRTIQDAYANLCDAYLVKPISKAKLLNGLRQLGLITT